MNRRDVTICSSYLSKQKRGNDINMSQQNNSER